MQHLNKVINMDCKQGMQLMIADNSIDAIVTDPPYGLSKQPKMEEVLRHWLSGDDYNATGSGFMGKTWDSFVPGPSIWKEAYRCLKPGAWAVVFAGSRTQDLMALSLRLSGFEIMDTGMWLYGSGFPKSLNISKAIGIDNQDSEKWRGWGTALKPAYEPFILARKTLDVTYSNNVLNHGVGGLNIDGCRLPDGNRFPANVIHDGLDEPWAKYFYCAKANKKDRDEGLERLNGISAGEMTGGRKEGSDGLNSPRAGAGRTTGARNIHPTVKPTDLMRYLCRLVTPTDGLILDPFSGSGSTGKAAALEVFNFIGFEVDEKYCEIANLRIINELKGIKK